jgi:exonuclease III
MKIMTWNINSVRLRAELVLKAADILKADVICLQETKTPDEFFPHDVFNAAGFRYRHINGMKSYNGVAILSRIPLSNMKIERWAGKDDCRVCHLWSRYGCCVTRSVRRNRCGCGCCGRSVLRIQRPDLCRSRSCW